MLAAWFQIDGRSHESLSDLSRVDAGVEDGHLLGLPGMGDSVESGLLSQPSVYSIPIHGLAADGSPEPPTPTPGTPEPPEPPVVVVPVGTPIPIYGEGVEQWRGLVASIFPAWAVDKALAVMDCESEGNPNATGAQGEMGLMQIMPYWHQAKADTLFGSGANLYDPYINLVVAHEISSGGSNWSAWTCQP